MSFYKNLPVSVKASLWFMVCSIVQKGIQIITVPIFTRLLSTEQYGQFSLYQSWLGIITIFGSLNLFAGAFNKAMLKFEDDRDRYISSMQGLSTLSTIILIMLFLINPNWWCHVFGLPELVIWFMILEVLFYTSLQYWITRQRYEFKYRNLVSITLFIAFANPILGLLLVNAVDEKGIARIISVSILNIIVGLVFYIMNLIRGKCYYDKEYWKYALSFNIPLIPHYLANIVLAQSDRIMIEKMYGTSEVAIYSVAYSIGALMTIVVNSVNSTFVPWTYQKCNEKKYTEISNVSNGLVLLIAIIALFPIMIAPEAVAIMGTEEYSFAVWVIPPISLSILMTFIYTLFANIEFYHEKSKFVMLASCITAILNIILNIIFMPIFGFVAAGYTTLVCYIVLAVMHYIFMMKVCKNEGVAENIYDIKYMIILGVVIAVISLVFMMLYEVEILRYIIILSMIVVLIWKRNFLIQLVKSIKQ